MEQMDALKAAQREGFVQRIVGHLKRFAPEAIAGLAKNVIHDRVRLGVRRAENHGIRGFGYTLAFVQTMFAIGPDFDQHPAVQAVLNDVTLPPDARVKKLFSAEFPTNWQEVAKTTHADAWAEDDAV